MQNIEPQHTARKIHAWAEANKLLVTEGMAEQLARDVIGIQRIAGERDSLKRQLDMALNARAELFEGLELLLKAAEDTGSGKTLVEVATQQANCLKYARSIVNKHKGKAFEPITKPLGA